MIRGVIVSLDGSQPAESVMHAIRMLRGVKAIMAVGDAAPNIDVDAISSVQLNLPKVPKALSVDDVAAAVARAFRVEKRKLTAKDRHKHVAFARHVAMFICYHKVRSWSYPELGHEFGKRDHTTVMSAVRKIELRVGSDGALRDKIDGIVHGLQMTGS
jgi:chromosomal replication initiator protein